VGVRRALRRPGVAGAVLLGVYALLALACDPGGFLGGDTGARIATLRAMSEGGWPTPEVGYWAARLDPAGRLHPMWLASRVGDHWVTVGTIPTLLVGAPLFEVGGYRALLVLPMAGAVLTAFAARRLSRALGSTRDGWTAFWLTGLASPVTVYALDFWDHALGLGLMLWAVATLVDLVEGDGRALATSPWRPVRSGAAAGVCFGLAAVLRTEAFVYGAVTAAVLGGVLLLRRRWRVVVGAGAAMAGAGAACLLANTVLERAVLGTAMRNARASGTLATADELGLLGRLKIAFLSGGALRPGLGRVEYAEALLWIVAVGALAWSARRGDHRRVAWATVLAGVTLGARMAVGLSFVPGLLAATPLAVVGLVLGWRARAGARLLLVAVAGFAVVVVTQYPQVHANGFTWAGRYVLLSGALAAVVGITALERLDRRGLAAGTALAVAVTMFGVVLLAQRSRDTAAWTDALTARTEAVIVSRAPEAFRDAGDAYRPDARWLAAGDTGAVRAAFTVAEEIDAPSLALVEHLDQAATRIAGWCRGDVVVVPWGGTAQHLRIVHYDRAGEASCAGS
jgi:hypothetical protein